MAKIGLQLWVWETVSKAVVIIKIWVSFSIWTTVNLHLPMPVHLNHGAQTDLYISCYSLQPEKTVTTQPFKHTGSVLTQVVIIWGRECPTCPSRAMVKDRLNRMIHNRSFSIFLLTWAFGLLPLCSARKTLAFQLFFYVSHHWIKDRLIRHSHLLKAIS